MTEILILDDNPKNCEECWISVQALYRTMPDVPNTEMCERLMRFCEADYEEKRPDWCPRRPVPERKLYDGSPYLEPEYVEGWNACLDAITGEEKK